ncbi:universal stress protein [Deinococcus psychrotolerans]|uniref:universal stress protein n=1 Tax=Deinococcus psychrotolerans TaxID=2489213 RepID=UPI0013DD95DE|nr:universal stress protein [Deinococcus psychrotolerans]
MFDHILVPIDGSPLSALALPVAAEMARCHHSTLTVLYVVLPLPMIYGDSAFAPSNLGASARAKAQGERLLEDAHIAMGSPNIRLLCLEDGDSDIAQAIADVAEQQQCSLVVMGTRGRSEPQHSVLDSVAEEVMCLVEMPVLLIRAPKTAPSQSSETEESQRAAMLEVSA